MKKVCPICTEEKDTILYKLSGKELCNFQELNLPKEICSACYQKELAEKLEELKEILIPLNEKKKQTQEAYYQAYQEWEEKANLYKSIDYNFNVFNYEKEKKNAAIAKALEKQKAKKEQKAPKELNIQSLAQKILANLSLAQQESIMKAFNNQQS